MTLCDDISVRLVSGGKIYLGGVITDISAGKQYCLKYAKGSAWINVPNAYHDYTYIINRTSVDIGGHLGAYVPVDGAYTSYVVKLFEVMNRCENVVASTCVKYISIPGEGVTPPTPTPDPTPDPTPTPTPPPLPDDRGTCAHARDNRNGVSWRIARMEGDKSVPWIRIRPISMSQPDPRKLVVIGFQIYDDTTGGIVFDGSVDEGETINMSPDIFTNAGDMTAIRLIGYNVDINAGTLDMRCCWDYKSKTNVNVSIYDENSIGVKGASVTYEGQTKTTFDKGFVSFLVLADVTSDLLVTLPSGYSRAGEGSFTLKDITADRDNNPETPQTVYIKVQKAAPVEGAGLTISLPALALTGSDVEISGTCPVAGLDVQIMAVRKFIGFDYLATDTVLLTTKVGADRKYSAITTFDEFGAVEMYAKTTDALKSGKSTILVLTPTILLALLAMLAMVLDKKYNFIGMFKKKRGKK